MYMGTVRLWCEPVIEQPVKRCGQFWEYRWKQFTCVTRRGGACCTSIRPHLWADCHSGRISFWTSLLCGIFLGEPRSSEMGEQSFSIPFLYNPSSVVLFPLSSHPLFCNWFPSCWSFWLLQISPCRPCNLSLSIYLKVLTDWCLGKLTMAYLCMCFDR